MIELDAAVVGLKNHGWGVKRWPHWIGRWHAFTPDFVVERRGLLVAIISKNKYATLTDVAIMQRVPVIKKIIVADDWIAGSAKSYALQCGVERIAREDLAECMEKLIEQNSSSSMMPRFLGWLKFHVLFAGQIL